MLSVNTYLTIWMNLGQCWIHVSVRPWDFMDCHYPHILENTYPSFEPQLTLSRDVLTREVTLKKIRVIAAAQHKQNMVIVLDDWQNVFQSLAFGISGVSSLTQSGCEIKKRKRW